MNAILPWKPRRGLWLPGGQPRINTAHPAAGFLSSAIVFSGQTAYDLRGRYGKSSVATGTPTLEATQVGQAVGFSTASLVMQAAPTGNFSLVVVARRTYTPAGGYGSIAAAVATSNSSAQTGITVELGNSFAGANQLWLTQWNAGSGTGIAGGWVDGVKQSATAPCDITVSNNKWYCIGGTWSGVTGSNGNLKFGALSNDVYGMTGGGVALCLIFDRILPDAMMAELTRDPGAALLWPDDDLWATLVGTSAGTTYNDTITAALTGAESLATVLTAVGSLSDALTAAESLTSALTAIASLSDAGTAAESVAAANVMAVTLADALTASEAVIGGLLIAATVSDSASSADSVTGGLLLSGTVSDGLTGADALASATTFNATLSDGASGAESLANALTAAATISGGVTAADGMSGGATAYSDGLDIGARASDSMAVTGGRAISDGTSGPSATGNTIQPPPRMTGDTDTDLRALTQWANHLYDQLVKAYNVTGRIVDHEQRISSLESPTTIH